MSYMSRRRNLAKVKKKLLLEWAELSEGISSINDTETLYRLLTARGSYDIFAQYVQIFLWKLLIMERI